MGKSQKKILKGADIRDGDAGKILRALGGQIRKAEGFREKLLGEGGASCLLRENQSWPSPKPGAAGFSLFSHIPHVLLVKNPLQEL